MKRLLMIAFIMSAFLYGCGGSSGSGSDAPDSRVGSSGVAVDPYLVGAVFCIDANENGLCEDSETESTPSDENGVFTFPVTLAEGDKIVMKTAGTHNGVPYKFDKMASEYTGSNLVVSPLTTLMERGLSAEDVALLLDPDGELGLSAEDVTVDPVAALEGLSGGVTDANLAAVRASIGAYMLLRMLENNPLLSGLEGAAIMENEDIEDIAEEVMDVVTDAITADKIQVYRNMLPPGQDVPDIDIMDVVTTAVTVCEHVMELAEAEYANTGTVGQAMAAVQQFKNNELNTFIDNTAPAQYIKRLIKNKLVQSELIEEMFEEYAEFVACDKGLKMNENGRPMCYRDDDDDDDDDDGEDGDDTDAQEIIADSPSFQYDFDSDSVEFEEAVGSIYGRAAFDDDSVGACYTNAVRNNASFDIPKVEMYRCVVAKAAEAELLSGVEDGVLYAVFTDDGLEHRAKIDYSEGAVSVNMCLDRGNEMVPDTENARISIVKTENGYDVEGVIIEDNDYNGEEEGGEVARGRRVYASAATTAANEIYSYIIHALNEQSEDCTGPSGAALAGDDDQCFLRYEGNIVYGEQDDNEYSIYNGLFAEKNFDRSAEAVAGSEYYYVGTAFATAMAGGYGYSVYTQPAETGFDYSSMVTEGWLGYTMRVYEIPAMLVQYFSGAVTPPQRTSVVPDIADPWNCEAEGDFVTIAVGSIPGIEDCIGEPLQGSGDVTTCSEGLESANLADQMDMYRCDSTDPLTNGGAACPD